MKGGHDGATEAQVFDLVRALVSRLTVGVLVLGADGAVVSCNPAAERLLGDGLSLEGDRLRVTDDGGARALRDVITAAVRRRGEEANGEEPSWTLRIPRPSKRPAYLVSVLPLAGQATAGLLALCTIVDPSLRGVPAAERVAHLFGLTGAEARVAVEVASGAVPKEVAARFGTSYATVRTHLQHVYDKTQLTSQAELVALLVQLGLAA